MRIIHYYQLQSTFNRFAINTMLLGATWYLFFFVVRYISFVHPLYEWLTQWLTHTLLVASQAVLLAFSEESLIYKKSLQQIGGNGIYLDRGCLGRNLMGLYAGFIVVFPGRVRSKLWFIPIGLMLIFGVNILRIVGLYITNKYYPQYMDINHHTVFKYTVYALTFLLWYIWIKYFRRTETATTAATTQTTA